MLILAVEANGTETGGLSRLLAGERDLRIETVRDGQEAVEQVRSRPFDGVVAVLGSGPLDEVELVRRIRRHLVDAPLVVVAQSASVELAVACMRAGATGILPRPVDRNALIRLLRRTSPLPPRVRDSGGVRQGAAQARYFLAGEHPLLDGVRTFADQVARTPGGTVLITGEPGTGKGSPARAIHALSGTNGRFVETHCGETPSARLGADLFGEDGGVSREAGGRRGLVETALQGTLYLAEIGMLPIDLQSRLLAFLDTRRWPQNGNAPMVSASVRIVASSSQDLREAVSAGRFLPELLMWLEVTSIRMPSLREMPEVIGELATRFLAEETDPSRAPPPALDRVQLDELAGYAWPGNVRELRGVISRFAACQRVMPGVGANPNILPSSGAGVLMPPGLTLEEVERRYLLAQLQSFSGDYASLAARLGISRKTLWEKRRRLGEEGVGVGRARKLCRAAGRRSE